MSPTTHPRFQGDEVKKEKDYTARLIVFLVIVGWLFLMAQILRAIGNIG